MSHPPLSRRRQKEIPRLARRRHRDASGEFVVEGLRSVESAVAAGAGLREVVVTEAAAADPRVATLLAQTDAPVFMVAEDDFARLADTPSAQGVLAVAPIQRADPAPLAPPLVVLDGVQDPGNVGAVVRTAAWFGASGVVCGPGTADPFGPKAARAAMGGLWDLALAETDDLPGLLDAWRQRGLRVYGADLDGTPAGTWQPDPAGVLVFGSEAHGLSAAVRERVEARVRIGGGAARGVESLNVAVAAGILLHRWLG